MNAFPKYDLEYESKLNAYYEALLYKRGDGYDMPKVEVCVSDYIICYGDFDRTEDMKDLKRLNVARKNLRKATHLQYIPEKDEL